jgi:hypothetical protein
MNVFIIRNLLRGWRFASKLLPFKNDTRNLAEIFSGGFHICAIHNCEGIGLLMFTWRLHFRMEEWKCLKISDCVSIWIWDHIIIFISTSINGVFLSTTSFETSEAFRYLVVIIGRETGPFKNLHLHVPRHRGPRLPTPRDSRSLPSVNNSAEYPLTYMYSLHSWNFYKSNFHSKCMCTQ